MVAGSGGRQALSLAKFIELFADQSQTVRRGVVIHYGSAAWLDYAKGYGYWTEYLPEGFVEQERYSDGDYRSVYENRELMAVITYCEGDIDVAVAPDRPTWLNHLADAEAFYSRFRGEPTAREVGGEA